MGHLQVVTTISDQLYRNAWSVLGESWEGDGSRSHYNSGYHGHGFSGGLPLVVCSALFLKVGTTVMLGNTVCVKPPTPYIVISFVHILYSLT